MTTITINVYRAGSEWFAARWIDSEYDGCDSLGIDDSASEAEAIEAAKETPMRVTGERIVTKVDDIEASQSWPAKEPQS